MFTPKYTFATPVRL